MKFVYFILLAMASVHSVVYGQKDVSDSLRKLLSQTQEDTSRALLLVQLSSTYVFYQPDSAIILVQQAILNAQRLHFAKGVGRGFNVLGNSLRLQGDLPQALETHFRALQISRTIRDPEGEASALVFIGAVYFQLGEYRQALIYTQQARQISGRTQSMDMLALSNIGEIYEKMNQLDSALFFQQQANDMLKVLPGGNRTSLILARLGVIQSRLGNYYGALGYYQKALDNAYLIGDLLNRGRNQYQIAEVYDSIGQRDSSLHYALLAFHTSNRVSLFTKLNAANLLVKLYQSRNHLDSAFYYQEVAIKIKDSLLGPKKFQQLQLLTLAEQERVQQLQEEQKRSKARIQLTGLLLVLGVFLFIVLFLWRTTRQQQRANRTLNQKNNQIEKQRNELEQTLTELKMAQAQLAHQEKMASLGELTAGIAHEIQNPLNFVNNFSEVNLEMNNELKEKLNRLEIGTKDKEGIEEILNDIENNEKKIIHHGKRADAIVKAMLLHSRTNASAKEPTDLNALVVEYLRLSYHGLRAKENSFNVTMETDYDQAIGAINIIPQEIGRVLLNLYNNAFYALSERQKQQPEGFEPTIFVSTKKFNNMVEIRIKDNGSGIPNKVLDKIFQPFFTTKPPGQGTGLGLSLSYDIVKVHRGEIKVETKEGAFTEFTIQIPVV